MEQKKYNSTNEWCLMVHLYTMDSIFMGEYICTKILSKSWIRFFYFRFCYHLNHIFRHNLCFLFICSIRCFHQLSAVCINGCTRIELKKFDTTEIIRNHLLVCRLKTHYQFDDNDKITKIYLNFSKRM